MGYKNLLIEKKESGVEILILNRPAALNALNLELLQELENYLHSLMQKSYGEVRALIVTGQGDKAFVAGADIKEMSGMNVKEAQKFSESGQRVFRLFETLRLPVIAAVNGFALGGGLELALSCDFIYASENAKLGLPEVGLGLIPGFGGTARLSRVVGINRAREMILTGEMISAQEAMNCGLINKVVPAADLMATVLKTAQTLASRGPIAVAKAKFSIEETFDLNIDQGLGLEAHTFAHLFEAQDTKEGMSAFIEKRKPAFKGN